MPYATVADLRAEGITVAQVSDARATELLVRASQFIDAVAGRWFELRSKTLVFDGNGCEFVWLDVPVVALSSVRMNGVAMDVSGLLVYSDRDNPRLVHRDGTRWIRGRGNIEIEGSFGVVNDDLSTPHEIRVVCMRLAIRWMGLLSESSSQSTLAADIKRESTDGHSYERFDRAQSTAGSWRYGGVTGDPEIDTVLRLFRRAPFVARIG